MSEKSKARVIKTDEEYIYIPAGSKERFLTSPSPQIQYLSKHHISMAGISNLVDGYRLDRWKIRHHLILYTLDGCGSLKIEDGPTRKLKAGDVFVAPAKRSYSYWTDERWDIVWLHLQADSKWDKPVGMVPYIRKASWAQELKREMEGYIGESDRRRADSASALHAYVDLIVLYLQRELGETDPDTADIRRILEGVWNEVQQHIKHKWTVEEMAVLARMSKSCFHRQVMGLTGFSSMQILNTMRMERASELLLYTNYTLNMIADEVGYENQFSFSKAFKHYSGSSPNQFRMKRSRK